MKRENGDNEQDKITSLFFMSIVNQQGNLFLFLKPLVFRVS